MDYKNSGVSFGKLSQRIDTLTLPGVLHGVDGSHLQFHLLHFHTHIRLVEPGCFEGFLQIGHIDRV